MKRKTTTSLFLALALSGAAHAATLATLPVYFGHATEADTFVNLGGGGGGTYGNRVGVASSNGPRTSAGTSSSSIWTITSAGEYTLTYYLDNSVGNPFQPGIQGLYDATGGVASVATNPVDVGGVLQALNAFVSLSGVTATTTPAPYPDIRPATGPVQFTTTYLIEEGSAAIGMEVAVGFYSQWGGGGGYLFGIDDDIANDVVLSFAPIPEPSAVLLGSLGFLALLRRRR